MLTRTVLLSFSLALVMQSAYATPDPPPDTYRELFEMREARGPASIGLDEIDDETGYDVLHYNVEIQFYPADHFVEGKVDMLIESTVASLTEAAMNLRSNMMVDSVVVNGVVTTYSLMPVDDYTVDLPQTLGLGDTTTITTYYNGYPIAGSMGALSWDTHLGTDIISSLSEPEGARTWWPCKDMPLDKATARMVWTVPRGLYATANGLLQSITAPDPDWRSYEWVEDYPITSYLIAVTATNFAHFRNWYVTALGDSIPLDHYVYPEDSLNATIDFADLADVITFFASVFGEYPFLDEKYGHAEFPWGGAMEHQTLTSYGEDLITGNNAYHWIMVHELSHQWWGDLVTCETWMDIWLNEGFATYCDALWTDYDQGFAAFQNRMADFRSTYFYYESGWEGRFPIYDPEYMWGGTVYQKGAWILHMIRYVIGEDNFWSFWAVYRDAFAFDAVTDAEFQQTLEDFTGLDLGWFFDEWVYMAGYPEYEWGWQFEQINEDSSRVDLSILQVQELVDQTPIFNMPIEIEVSTTTGYEVHVVDNSQQAQNFSFNVSGVPLDVTFDPDVWILKTDSETGFVGVPETTPQPTVYQLDLAIHPNPANPTAQISITMPQSQHASVAIYNLMGQKVATLIDGVLPQGATTLNWDARHQPSGIYLVRLETPTEQMTKKLTVVK